LKTEEFDMFKTVFTENSIVGLIYEVIFRGEVLLAFDSDSGSIVS